MGINRLAEAGSSVGTNHPVGVGQVTLVQLRVLDYRQTKRVGVVTPIEGRWVSLAGHVHMVVA